MAGNIDERVSVSEKTELVYVDLFELRNRDAR